MSLPMLAEAVELFCKKHSLISESQKFESMIFPINLEALDAEGNFLVGIRYLPVYDGSTLH